MSDHPDFSGAWRVDFSQSELEIEVPTETMIRIEHKDPLFHLTRTHKSGDYEDTFSIQLSTDGSESVIHKQDIHIRSKCTWQGSSLCFASKILHGASEADNVVVYTLSPDGRQLSADERFSGEPKSYHNRWVCVKE